MRETGQTRAVGAKLGGGIYMESEAYGFLDGQTRLPSACTHEGWTDERIEILTREWATGKSCGQIARVLGGVTRNAVIGKVCRLGLPKRGQASKPGKVARAIPVGRRASPIVVIPFPDPEPETAVRCEPRPWTTRQAGECSWIVAGRGADSMACCNVAPRRWCAEHEALGSGARTATVNELARSLRRYL